MVPLIDREESGGTVVIFAITRGAADCTCQIPLDAVVFFAGYHVSDTAAAGPGFVAEDSAKEFLNGELLVESIADVERLEVRDPTALAFVTQTTLSVDDTAAIVEALRRRFPTLLAPRKEDICYATQNRQDAVKQLLEHCGLLVVVGSRSSSNSNRLRELADRAGVPVW